ncbi:Na-translocating system protein MpsC family protein [Fredinandcohnia humi]
MFRETKQKQEELTYISSFVSKLIKTKFGKGPETCFTTVSDNYIVIHVKKFMTQIEDELINKEEIKAAQNIRTLLTVDLFHPLQEMLQSLLHVSILQVHQDWNFASNTGVILLFLGDKRGGEERENALTFELLKNEVIKRSEFALYQPKTLDIKKISSEIYIIRSTGFLLPIEKSILTKGYQYLLEEREREIRENYQKNRNRFERILLKDIEDIFMIWNYQDDVTYTVIYCK